MNQKTDSDEGGREPSEFSREFIYLLVSITIAILTFTFLFRNYPIEQHAFRVPGVGSSFEMYLGPWTQAGAITIDRGLAEFSGKTVGLVASEQQVAILIRLLILLILGPTLFFLGWRKRIINKETESLKSTWRGSTILCVFGGILVFSIAIPAVPGAIIQHQVENNLKQAQAIQDNKDCMINDLHTIANDAYQFIILPKSLNGGNGSYGNYVLPLRLRETANARYEMKLLDPHILQIQAQSIPYSTCRITMRIDSLGQMGMWEYEGEFR